MDLSLHPLVLSRASLRSAAQLARDRDQWNESFCGASLLLAAGLAGVSEREMVRAACACAAEVVPHTRTADPRPRRALSVTQLWLRGATVAMARLDRVSRAALSAAKSPRAGILERHAAFVCSGPPHVAWHVLRQRRAVFLRRGNPPRLAQHPDADAVDMYPGDVHAACCAWWAAEVLGYAGHDAPDERIANVVRSVITIEMLDHARGKRARKTVNRGA